MTYLFKFKCAMSLMACLTACGAMPLSPVSEQSTGLRRPETEYREVSTGDTLYSIAWESGRDYRNVARWNDISPPYVIKPGQKLRLFPPTNVERIRQLEQKPTSATSNQLTVTSKKPASKKKTADEKSEPLVRPQSPVNSAEQLSWSWPAEGNLLERFSTNGPNKGIDISGKKGQAILAAAAGRVVYQGGGLRGYGQLIIIKHNADFLSAYAHCDKIYVKEGDMIKRSQKIADMGSSGADKDMLHFEIRYRGVPVDPQEYLPRK